MGELKCWRCGATEGVMYIRTWILGKGMGLIEECLNLAECQKRWEESDHPP